MVCCQAHSEITRLEHALVQIIHLSYNERAEWAIEDIRLTIHKVLEGQELPLKSDMQERIQVLEQELEDLQQEFSSLSDAYESVEHNE